MWCKFYPFLFASILCYFLRIIQYFLMKFCTVVLGIILVVNTFKQCPLSVSGHLGYFRALFWDMCLFFLISVQYSVMRFCSGVLGITLIITNTCFDIMSLSSGGHSRVFWGLFWHITSTF